MVVLGVAALLAACSANPEAEPGPGLVPDDQAGGSIGAPPDTGPIAPEGPSAPPTTGVGNATSFRMAATKASTAGCQMFPPDHFLNATGIDRLPVHPRSTAWLGAIGGTGAQLKFPTSRIWESARGGMPINVVDSRETGFSNVTMNPWGSSRSYRGPYPIPDRPKVQGHPTAQWDKHLLIIDVADCTAYELIQYDPVVAAVTGRHTALAGTRYPLNSSDWPAMTTNAPKTPMLGQYVLESEVLAGRIDHAIGFCTDDISTSHIWPARASDGRNTSPDAMPMGAWVRLRADVDLSGFGPHARTVARALRQHGAVLTDTCSHDFHLMAENSATWDDDDLTVLRTLSADDFEVVDTEPLLAERESFRIR